MLSLVVITRDEVDRIGACLDSVPFAAEKVVVDCGSTDGTVEVARRHGARVVVTDWPGHVAQKNRALALATQPWILSLDADERLSAEAAAQIPGALRDGVDGLSLPRCNHWLGKPLRHGRWYPDRKVRVTRAGRGTWVGDDPHDRLAVDGRVVPLSGDILHTPYRDLGEHLRTIDRYTRVHAASLRARGVRAHWWDVGLRPPLHFVDALLLRGGVRDGRAGVAVAALGSVHVALKWSRLWRLR